MVGNYLIETPSTSFFLQSIIVKTKFFYYLNLDANFL